MLRILSGVLGVVVAALMALGAGYILVTASIPGYRGTAILALALYVVAIGVIGTGVSLARVTLSTSYW